jgi:hypothetical protein
MSLKSTSIILSSYATIIVNFVGIRIAGYRLVRLALATKPIADFVCQLFILGSAFRSTNV